MDYIRKGNILVTDNNKVLIEYTQSRFLRLTDEAAAIIIEKIGNGSSLLGVYDTIGGISFSVDKNGKRVPGNEISPN